MLIFLKFYNHNLISQATTCTNSKQFISPDTTEVFVLGVLHKPSKLVSYDSLYNLLEKIKPNIILFECDSTAFDKHMQFHTLWWRMALPDFLSKYRQGNLEEIAVKKYLFHNPSAILRPYEWSQRDLFHKQHNLDSMSSQLFYKIEDLIANNKLKEEHKKTYADFISLSEQLEKYGDSTLYEINTIAQDSIGQRRQNHKYHLIKQIVDSYDELKNYRAFSTINESYWDVRNKAMATNINRYITFYPHSRIVVLNGYFHRYYLRQELRKNSEEKLFLLKDLKR